MADTQKNSHLVVVGSSAGGIEALSKLVSALPEGLTAPVVIAQHLDPARDSRLQEILARKSRLPVRTVADHDQLEAGVVYVIPSDRHINVTETEIDLRADTKGRPKPSVDMLMSSAAGVFGENLIAVVLTGTGSDGAEGARAVRHAGGTVVIQDPETAEFGGIPGSLAPNTVDIVADLERIGPILGELLAGVETREEREVSPVDEDLLRVAYLAGHQIGQFIERRRAEDERDRALARETEARQRIGGVLESINDAFLAVDEAWRFTYVNRRAEEFLNRRRGDLLGKNVWEEYPSEVGTEAHGAILEAARTGETVGYEAFSPMLNAWISGRAYPSSHGVSVYFQDVTEIREARKTIEDRERRYRSLTSNIPGAVFRCVHRDGAPTMEFVSGHIEEITGYPAGDFIEDRGRSYVDVIHPEDRSKNDSEVWGALEERTTYNIEYRIVHRDGGLRWVNERGCGIFSEDGGLLWIDGAIFDITARKRAEEALRRSEERYRTLFERIGEGFCIVDVEFDGAGRPTDLLFLETNPAFERMTGLEGVAGKRARELIPGLEGWWIETYGKVALTGEAVHFENRSEAMGRWFEVRASRIGGQGSRRVALVFDDITERKRAAEERERLLAQEWVAQAEAAEREKISRELHDRVAHSMAVAHQSLQLHRVFAEKDAGRAEAKLDLAREMIKASLESTRNLSAELRHLGAEENLEAELRHLLDVVVPPDVRAGVRVSGDEAGVPGHVRGQLFLVLREAVSNAVSHSGCDSLSVGLDIEPGRIVGSVEDDGRGFDASKDGGGVGLRSMRERTALLNGALDLDCEPGRGTRVEVSVPLNGGR